MSKKATTIESPESRRRRKQKEKERDQNGRRIDPLYDQKKRYKEQKQDHDQFKADMEKYQSQGKSKTYSRGRAAVDRLFRKINKEYQDRVDEHNSRGNI